MSKKRSVWVLVVLCAAVGIVVASVTSLYVAGEEISRDTNASQNELTWILDSYTLVLAGLLLPAGALADRYGRRGVMVVGLLVFIAAAAVVQFVDSPDALIASRAALGVGAALILPPTLSIITSSFPEDFRVTAVNVWTAAFSLSGVIGGTIAAILLEYFSWRSAFWSVLVGAVLVLAACPTLPTSREARPPRVDVPGSIAAMLAIGAIVYGFIEAGIRGWTDPVIIGALAIGVLAAAAFTALQLKVAQPLLDVRLFKQRAFGVAAFAVVMCFAAVYGVAFLVIPYGQIVYGDTPLVASLPMAAMAITVVPLTMAATRITERIGLRLVLWVGCVACAGGFAILLASRTGDARWVLFGSTLVIGVGLGLSMAPCTATIVNSVSAEKQGVAASINHTTREVGTALGIALFGGLVSGHYAAQMSDSTATLPEPAREVARDSAAGALKLAEQQGAQGAPLAEAAQDAYVKATQHTSLVMIFVMLGAAFIVAQWAPGPSPRRRAIQPGATDPAGGSEIELSQPQKSSIAD